MTFKLLKRRYRSSENNEKLRELEYFNHPYAKGSSIKLIDDIEMTESISCTSLASDLIAVDNPKRGKKNAVEREKKEKDEDPEELINLTFEPFDMGKGFYKK
jgi:hypothetical protein